MRILDNLGPYLDHPPVKAFCEISAKAYLALHTVRDQVRWNDQSTEQQIVLRMTYLAEATSTAIRLNSSWALSTPALSLLRDRYEQTVRFSWLAKNNKIDEWIKYMSAIFAKQDSLFRSLNKKQYEELRKLYPDADDWANVKMPPKTRKYLSRWEKMSLEEMAKRRDELEPISNQELAKATLYDLYTSVYRQFSSLSHNDFYSLQFIGLHRNKLGVPVLAPEPSWPALICLQNALFDLIQCNEASYVFYSKSAVEDFDDQYNSWKTCLKEMGI